MKDFFWFARYSWYFLGCDEGSGRWRARREYVLKFCFAYYRYRREMKKTLIFQSEIEQS